MEEVKEDIMLKFLDVIVGEVGEYEIFNEESNSKYYFTHGGCFELYKIVAHFIPNVKMVMRKDYGHCAISYNDIYYDANGIIIDRENYIPATEKDFSINEDLFSPKIKELKASSIIKNINNNVSLKGILD